MSEGKHSQPPRNDLVALRRDIRRQADGGFLYRTRQITGKSQGFVEQRTGVDVTVISRLETGRRELKPDLEDRLLPAFQVLLEGMNHGGPDLVEHLRERRARVEHQIRNASGKQALEGLLRYYKERRTYASSQGPAEIPFPARLANALDASDPSFELHQQARDALERVLDRASGMESTEAVRYVMALRNFLRSATYMTAAQLDQVEATASSALVRDDPS